MTSPTPTRRSGPRLSRPLVVAVLVVLAGVVVAGASQTWASAEFPGGAGARPVELALSGNALARPAVALALVVGAAALALTLARRRGRLVILAGIAAAGAAVSWVSAAVLLDPAQAVRPPLAEQAGLTAASIPPEQIQVALTAWPWVCATGGLLTVVVAAVAWPASRAWDSSSRFEAGRGAGSGSPDPATTWDALSDGDDPTR